MYISKVKIHNFRSVGEAEFPLQKYSLLVGENNAGKTNIISALRVFYEEIKYDSKNDFPKFKTKDKESWIELTFTTTSGEQNNLKEEYKDVSNLLIVRKFLQSSIKDLVKSSQSNIYAYEKRKLALNLFYGAKNISQAKLGRIIYIPELSKTDDSVKMSGPSPLREMINFVMGKVAKTSKSFEKLQASFDKFNNEFKNESSEDGFSIKELVNDVNKNIAQWGIDFGIEINPISSDDIIKNLLSHYIEDKQLGGEKVNINMFGQGLQRHLIYTLIRLSAKYVDKKEETKKEFSPDFNLILFEEPEAFLHPAQQEILNISLTEVSSDPQQQIMITTHSPVFVSRNIEDITMLLRVSREAGISKIFFVTKKDLDNIFDDNSGLYKIFHDKLLDKGVPDTIRKSIKEKGLASDTDDINIKMEEESLRFSLWLDYDRSSSFFSKHVIICEGASEKVLLDYLFNKKWPDLKSKHVYCLDSMGKFNIHRFMNLFNKFGISHSVLYDNDDGEIQKIVNKFLNDNMNTFSKSTYAFNPDLESFLKIPKPNNRADKKPLNIMWHLFNNKVEDGKLSELKAIIENLI